MPSKAIVENTSEPSSHAIPPPAVCSEQWWQTAGYYHPFPLTEPVGNAPEHTLLHHPGMMPRSKNEQSSSGDEEEEEETSKDSETTGSNSTHRDGSSRQELQQSQCGDSSMSLGGGESFPQHPQLELVGHSMACAPPPYPDMYYGGMMAAYGTPPMVPPQFYGMHQPRMPLPLELAQEPVYVNAKQYRGILRRRQVRAKAELERKLIKSRKPYLHESRHQHALRRARGTGGRFAKKGEVEGASSSQSTEDKGKTSDIGEQHKNEQRGTGEARSGEGQSNPQWASMSSDQARRRALAI